MTSSTTEKNSLNFAWISTPWTVEIRSLRQRNQSLEASGLMYKNALTEMQYCRTGFTIFGGSLTRNKHALVSPSHFLLRYSLNHWVTFQLEVSKQCAWGGSNFIAIFGISRLGLHAYYAKQGLCYCRVSVRLFVCCCRFAAVGPAGRRYRSIAARRTAARQANAGSATLRHEMLF